MFQILYSNKKKIYDISQILRGFTSYSYSYTSTYNQKSNNIFPQSLNFQSSGAKIMATSTDGILYEKAIGSSLCKMYPGLVQDETQIASQLSKYTSRYIDTLRGIDFTIRNPNNNLIYALQVKIGIRTRGVKDIGKFVHTLDIFHKYINSSSTLSIYKVIPVWYSSADLDIKARNKLSSSGVYIFMDSEWNLEPTKCKLFINFTNWLNSNSNLPIDN
jgi:hypothetical protein